MKTHLGKHKIALKKLITKINASTKGDVDLIYTNKKKVDSKKGKVLFRANLTSSAPVAETVAPVVNKEKEKESNKGKDGNVDSKSSIPSKISENKVDETKKDNKKSEQTTNVDQQKLQKDNNPVNIAPVEVSAPQDQKFKDNTTGKFDSSKSNTYKGPCKLLTLTLESLEAKELVDKGTFYDPQDPLLQIKIGSQSFSTER